MALGVDVRPDYRALPRATYTDPEAASVGLTLDQAKAAGIDAVEYVADFATSSQGYALEAELGHVTVTFDRATRADGRRGDGLSRTRRRRSTSASWRSRRGCRSRSWPTRSTRSRRRRGSSTACSPRRRKDARELGAAAG